MSTKMYFRHPVPTPVHHPRGNDHLPHLLPSWNPTRTWNSTTHSSMKCLNPQTPRIYTSMGQLRRQQPTSLHQLHSNKHTNLVRTPLQPTQLGMGGSTIISLLGKQKAPTFVYTGKYEVTKDVTNVIFSPHSSRSVTTCSKTLSNCAT